jgi:hypothetical protein
MDVPKEYRAWFRNPDGCLSPSTPICTTSGLVRIDQLDPAKHAILYHAADGAVRATNRYAAFPTKIVDSLLVLEYDGRKVKLTHEHRVAVSSDGPVSADLAAVTSYRYAEAQTLGLREEKHPGGLAVWDIANGEACWAGEGNFFANGVLVHNSCVQCSLALCGLWNNLPVATTLLWDTEYGPKVRGGSWPGRVAEYSRKRGIPIYNVTGRETFEWMDWAAKTGRFAAIGAGGSHFQALYGWDPPSDTYYVNNNNSTHRIDTYSDSAFRRLHLASGQWCVILDVTPCPPPPVYSQWWAEASRAASAPAPPEIGDLIDLPRAPGD